MEPKGLEILKVSWSEKYERERERERENLHLVAKKM